MAEIRIYDAANKLKEVTAEFLPKIQGLSIRESLNGEADSLSLNLANNPQSENYWSPDYFEDREISLKIEVNGVNFGVFNFDEIDFDFSERGFYINMKGLSAPVTTGKSIYQQVRKVWSLASLENILTQIAELANMELSYFFDDFKLKLQVNNEFIFNVFGRLADKYGAITKVYREELTGKYKILFYGRKDLAENAVLLKKSEIAETLGRGEGLLKFDANNPDKNNLSINFRIMTKRKELKIIYYDPQAQKTYTKISKNKSKLIIEDSRRDYEITKVTSQQEAEIVARKVETEPTVTGEISARFNKDFISGNIIEFRNYKTLSGYYLITESTHNFSEDSDGSSCFFERLPDENLSEYLKYLN